MEPEVRESSKRISRSQTEIEKNSESKGGKRRKIRAIQDFDNLNRSSLFLVQHENSTEKSKTKKQKNFDFLPKIGLSNEDTKENSPLSYSTKNKVTPKRKLKPSNDLVNLHKQLLKSNVETLSNSMSSVLSPQDDDIEFKPRIKNKQFNSHAINDKSHCVLEKEILTDNIFQDSAKSFKRLEKSLCKKQNNNDSTLEKSYEKNCIKKKSQNGGRQSNPSTLSRSFKVLINKVTPDTSGNNQGLFDVTYPTDAECMNNSSLLSLSSLEMNLESARSRNSRKTIGTNEMSESTVKTSLGQILGNTIKTNLNQITVNTKNGSSELDNTNQIILESQHNNLRKTSRGSIINLVTPSPKKRTAFDHDDSLHTPTPTKLTPICTKTANDNQSTLRIPFIRSGTFTKEQPAAKCLKDTPNRVIVEKSALNGATPNMRKRWTKSLGVSLLDNSGKVHLISAPPLNDSLVDSPSTVFPLISSKQKKIENLGGIQKCFASTPMTNIKQKGLPKDSAIKLNCDFKSIKKTKMPNFAQIHQKAYDKLENIKEMSERKAVRAQKLLSGHKPEIGMTNKSPSKSRKALNYSPGKHTSNTKIAARIPVVQPVLPNKINKINTSNKKTLKKRSLDKKCILKPGFIVDKSDKTKKAVLKQEQLKAFANKKHIVTDTVESRRKVVQNVRTNRRFELLMQMRKK